MFQHLFFLMEVATWTNLLNQDWLGMFSLVSTPFLPNGSRYTFSPAAKAVGMTVQVEMFQHLFFLMEVATTSKRLTPDVLRLTRLFQHLFFLMEVATCWLYFLKKQVNMKCFNTFSS
jgi:hypothetical protein